MLFFDSKSDSTDGKMRLLWMALAAVVGLLVYGLVNIAKAQGLVPETGELDVVASLQLIIEAIHSGNLWLAAAVLLSGLVWLLRTQGVSRLPAGKVKSALQSDLGGFVFTFLVSFVGAFVTALAAGSPMNGALVLSAVKVAVTAIAGYVGIRQAQKAAAPPKAVPTPGA